MRQIAQVANRLQMSCPGIRFHIVSGDAVDVCERLDKGLLDFGILLGDMDKTKYHYMAVSYTHLDVYKRQALSTTSVKILA